MNRKKASSLVLMNQARIHRALDRMAYQIMEEAESRQGILVVGLKERGMAVAEALSEHLQAVGDTQVTLVGVDEVVNHPAPPYVVLVDDVIFSGQTMCSAIQTMLAEAEPVILRTAVLVDRGHRRMPIDATFAALRLPTKQNEHVSVEVQAGTVWQVMLT